MHPKPKINQLVHRRLVALAKMKARNSGLDLSDISADILADRAEREWIQWIRAGKALTESLKQSGIAEALIRKVISNYPELQERIRQRCRG